LSAGGTSGVALLPKDFLASAVERFALCFGRRLADFLDQCRLDAAAILGGYSIGELVEPFGNAVP
jgi:hypothetical protein